MTARAFLALAALALAACAAPEPARVPDPVPVRVTIPIPVPCTPPMPERPRWALDAVPIEATIDELMAAALAEVEQRRGYETRLEAALASCNPEPKP